MGVKKKSNLSSNNKINIALMIAAAIAFAALGIFCFLEMNKWNGYFVNHRHVTNSPGLCFERICRSGTEETETDPNKLALYLDESVAFAQGVTTTFISQTLLFVSCSFSIAFFLAAIIYWNHNR